MWSREIGSPVAELHDRNEGTNLCAVLGRQSGIVGTAAELDDSRFNRLVEQDLVRGANQMGVAIDRTQRNLSDTYATFGGQGQRASADEFRQASQAAVEAGSPVGGTGARNR